MNFGEKLTNLRKQKGLSQEELGEELNVTRQTISKWELGQTSPDANKLKEIAKLFEISLDELTSDAEVTNVEKEYKESNIEKKNKKLSLKIFVCGLIISIILCGIGLIKQNNAKKTNKAKEQQALAQSQSSVDAANQRLKEIEEMIIPLQEQYEKKRQEADSMNMGDPNWFADHSKVQREASSINQQINDLEQERFIILNKDYTVYYSPVKPITYLVFYYIAGGVFVLISLISLIYFLVTRKK